MCSLLAAVDVNGFFVAHPGGLDIFGGFLATANMSDVCFGPRSLYSSALYHLKTRSKTLLCL